MTKATFNPHASAVSPVNDDRNTASSAPKTGKDADSTFIAKGRDRWKAMTKSVETPSVIGSMLEGVDTGNTTATETDREQAYLGGLMCGDAGNVRVSDGKHLLVEDHEEIHIPDVRKLFVEYPSLQEHTFPLLERLTLLRKTIQGLIDTNTEALKHGGMSTSELQGAKDYLNYLYDCMHELHNQLDVVDFYRQNELAARKASLETDAEGPGLTEEQQNAIEDAIEESNEFWDDLAEDIEDSMPQWW